MCMVLIKLNHSFSTSLLSLIGIILLLSHIFSLLHVREHAELVFCVSASLFKIRTSTSIYLVTNGRVLFFLMAEKMLHYIIGMPIQTLCTLVSHFFIWTLKQILQLGSGEHCRHRHGFQTTHWFLCPLGFYPEMGQLGDRANLFLVYLRSHNLFQRVVLIYIPTSSTLDFFILSPSTLIAIVTGLECNLIVAFIYFSLEANDSKELLIQVFCLF